MAYLITKDGKKLTISREQGMYLWKSLRDPTGLDEQTLTRISKIKALYLNWRNAPDDYVKENLAAIIPLALDDWYVSGKGTLLKPQSEHAWTFGRRWGLWEMGQPSLLVSRPTLAAQTPFAADLEVNDR